LKRNLGRQTKEKIGSQAPKQKRRFCFGAWELKAIKVFGQNNSRLNLF
jgi:hypothetical protein